jgi:hypothetical protein
MHVTAGRGLFQSSLPGALGPFQLLSGVIRPEKLGLDPTFQVIALYLHPVPLTLRNFEAFALGDYPKNTSIRRGCRPDVHAGTLHKRDILVLARGDGLARRGISGRRGRGNLGRGLESHGGGRSGQATAVGAARDRSGIRGAA